MKRLKEGETHKIVIGYGLKVGNNWTHPCGRVQLYVILDGVFADNLIFFFFFFFLISRQFNQKYSHINGDLSDVGGMIPEKSCWKSVNANTLLIPKETFSPDSVGRMKTIRVISESKPHGIITVNT